LEGTLWENIYDWALSIYDWTLQSDSWKVLFVKGREQQAGGKI
jgi:hypothetical protein